MTKATRELWRRANIVMDGSDVDHSRWNNGLNPDPSCPTNWRDSDESGGCLPHRTAASMILDGLSIKELP